MEVGVCDRQDMRRHFFLSQKDTELELELELEIKPAKANVLRKQKALLRRDDH
jgi:hypothetical protein